MKRSFRLVTTISLIVTVVSTLAFVALVTTTDGSVWRAIVGIFLLISATVSVLCLSAAAVITTTAQIKAKGWRAVGQLLLEMAGYFLILFFLDYFLEKDRDLFDIILTSIAIPFAFRAGEYI